MHHDRGEGQRGTAAGRGGVLDPSRSSPPVWLGLAEVAVPIPALLARRVRALMALRAMREAHLDDPLERSSRWAAGDMSIICLLSVLDLFTSLPRRFGP